MSRLPIRARLLAAALTLSSLLAACGGGGGGGASTVTPTPTPVASLTLAASPTAITAGQNLTLTWSSQNTGASACTASGAWSGSQAASGSATVAAPALEGAALSATATYTLTCASTVASTTVTVNAPPAANVVAMTVDGGPSGAGNQINLPYVSVTVCKPGTSTCVTIDHILVDTGSYGLRLLAPQALALGLPAVTAPSGAAAGECGQFVGGYTWGAVVSADIKLGGETASAQSVQLIGGSPGGVTATPASCSSVGGNIGTVSALGANGILGVGLLRQDCGAACVNSAISATYYSCTGSSCSASRMPLASQVSNPVAAFAVNNNGVLLRLPAVGAGGASALDGSLVFGIGTAANNAIAGETILRANSAGNLTTIYKGVTMSASFLDSGSNGLFFNDAALPVCTVSKGFYCPTSTLNLNATMAAADGSASRSIDFMVENVESLGNGIHAANVGGPSGSTHAGGANAFDWGLPFFFGRRVFVGMENGATRGYWAY